MRQCRGVSTSGAKRRSRLVVLHRHGPLRIAFQVAQIDLETGPDDGLGGALFPDQGLVDIDLAGIAKHPGIAGFL